MMITPSLFILDTFSPLVGQIFHAQHHEGGDTVELRLVEAEAIELNKRDGRLRSKSGSLRRDPFTLVFLYDRLLQQGIYTMHNEVLGEISISIVPIGPFDEGWGHEAVFN
jgi:hypothetical protein